MPHEAPGWYGKLSSHGDFAARRLPEPWVRAMDDWLCAAVSASRERLGAQWQTLYLNAPVWRFAFAPGVLDAQWWFGVLMPSCDNVGRYFPLVVAQARTQPPTDRVGLDHLDAWWGQVAWAALSTLAEGSSVEAFEAELQAAPPWPGPASRRPPVAPETASGWLRQSTPVDATLSELVFAQAAHGLQAQLAGMSYWWPLGTSGEGGSYTATAGLPPPEAFTQMLEGGF